MRPVPGRRPGGEPARGPPAGRGAPGPSGGRPAAGRAVAGQLVAGPALPGRGGRDRADGQLPGPADPAGGPARDARVRAVRARGDEHPVPVSRRGDRRPVGRHGPEGDHDRGPGRERVPVLRPVRQLPRVHAARPGGARPGRRAVALEGRRAGRHSRELERGRHAVRAEPTDRLAERAGLDGRQRRHDPIRAAVRRPTG